MEDIYKVPFRPCNGRILVRQLPYKPSTIIELVSRDKADENEGIVVALSPFRYGRKKLGANAGARRGEIVYTSETFPHEVALGDRVLFSGRYLDDDTMTFNGVKHRCLDSWEIVGILDKPQPEGYDSVITGEHTPDKHPLLIQS